jgi:hypothetical protein
MNPAVIQYLVCHRFLIIKGGPTSFHLKKLATWISDWNLSGWMTTHVWGTFNEVEFVMLVARLSAGGWIYSNHLDNWHRREY